MWSDNDVNETWNGPRKTLQWFISYLDVTRGIKVYLESSTPTFSEGHWVKEGYKYGRTLSYHMIGTMTTDYEWFFLPWTSEHAFCLGIGGGGGEVLLEGIMHRDNN